MVSSQSAILRLFGRVVKTGGAKWRLHPLIHTSASISLAQSVAHSQADILGEGRSGWQGGELAVVVLK